jgi:hypothetical protein
VSWWLKTKEGIMKFKKINSWELEQYILNELPKERVKEIDIQLKEDPVLRKEIETLKQSDKAILDQYPPDAVVPQILNRVHLEKSKETYEKERAGRTRPAVFKRLLVASPAAALVLVLLFIILPFHKGTIDPAGQKNLPNGTRIKGSQTIDWGKPNLILYRKNNDHAEVLKDGMKANPGDLLQIAYIAAEEKYGVILSIDGNGVTTLHHPGKENQTALLDTGKKKVLLRSAYELDDAPGFERFFFITSKQEINVEEVMKQAKILAGDVNRAKTNNITLNDTLSQTSTLILKGELP